MEFIKFPSIEQFRTVIKKVNDRAKFAGKDENGDAIFDHSKTSPTLKYVGFVKGHGTNSGIKFNPVTKEIECQSRNNNISVDSDNAGFARFVENNKEVILNLFNSIENPDSKVIAIFGEWAGKGIQKGVAISQVDKFFSIFKVKVGENYVSNEVLSTLKSNENRIFNMTQFGSYEIEIDFNRPEFSQNTLVDLTLQVEKECPIGKFFGVSGIGEGIVWSCVTLGFESSDFWFKTKGEEHSVSKVTKIAAVDIEKIKSNEEFVEKTVTENRLRQGLEYLKEMKIELSPKSTGEFIRWVHNDILKEEKDVMDISGISEKDLGKLVSVKAKTWFFQNM